MYKVYGIIDEGRIVYIGYTDNDIDDKEYYYKVYGAKRDDIHSIKEYSYKDCIILKDNIEDWKDAIEIKKMLVDILNPIYNKINNNGLSNYIVLPLVKKDAADAALGGEYNYMMLLLF